ncbi:TetR/AcrR family transcriptional regulator [Streptomyces albicerus]|uniref:TetR/AcrR family transcriptional regulator n=1 Tax=Streptomyces albicerus TaxID=2569859 RepID=UPI00124B88AD|nr:TetR/AcrR family transcriptional regulator [Streptomyces albicerus]
MQPESTREPRSQDRRVLRSRSALMAAAERLVSERGTTDIPVKDLAEAADVSRQLVYLQFGDRDALLVETAADLVRRELVTQAGDDTDAAAGVSTMARHFARHRGYYRAMLTGSCAFAMTRTLNSLFGSANEKAVGQLFDELDDQTTRDLTAFVAGGTGAVVNDWLTDGDDPLDPEELTQRLLRLASVFAGSSHTPTDGGPVR